MLVIRPIQLSLLEQESRRQIALSVLAELRTSTPHAVAGLTSAELDFRLDTAISKSVIHQLDSRDDVKAFIRLSLIVGTLFDEYSPLKDILSGHDRETRIPALFVLATPNDWNNASQFDILSRYRKMPGCAAISLTALEAHHADAYWRHALHPDVWRLGRMKPMTDVDEVLQLIRDLEPASKSGYAIVDQQGQFLGAVFANHNETGTRVSYWIARPVWGQGIASQALLQLKNALQSETLMLTIEPGNTPSLKIAAKCGFQQTDSVTFVA